MEINRFLNEIKDLICLNAIDGIMKLKGLNFNWSIEWIKHFKWSYES